MVKKRFKWDLIYRHCELPQSKAADKNTNEGSQGENVSTVVLIDLTDTSSVSQWKRKKKRNWLQGTLINWGVALYIVLLLAWKPPQTSVPLLHALTFSKYCSSLCVLNLSIHLPFNVAPLSFLNIVLAVCAHSFTPVRLCALFQFKGYHLVPVPVALSPKSLLHQSRRGSECRSGYQHVSWPSKVTKCT